MRQRLADSLAQHPILHFAVAAGLLLTVAIAFAIAIGGAFAILLTVAAATGIADLPRREIAIVLPAGVALIAGGLALAGIGYWILKPIMDTRASTW